MRIAPFSRRSLSRAWRLVLLWFGLAVPAAASITPVFVSQTLDNFTGDLIASDRDNAATGYDRDALHARVTYLFHKTPGPLELTNCEWRFLLLEENSGAAVPLNLPGGGTGPILTVARPLFFPPTETVLTLPEIVLADLSPASRLMPGTRYKVRCQFWRDGSLVEVKDDLYRRIWHFPYLTPGSIEDKAMSIVESAALERNNLVRSQTGQDAFKLAVTLTVRRYDVWTLASPPTTNISVPVVVSLTNASTAAAVTLTNAGTNHAVAAPYFAFSGGVRVPSTITLNLTLEIRPTDWNTLDPVPQHHCRISARDSDDQGVITHDYAAFSRYLAGLTGDIYFGPLRATFAALTNDFAGAAIAPTTAGYRCKGSLTLAAGVGRVPGKPHTFSLANQEVHMANNGNLHVTQAGGVFITAVPPSSPDRETINNTIFERGPTYLTLTGAQSDGWKLHLPRGMGYSLASAGSRRRLQSKMIRTSLQPLGTDLLPTADPVVGSAANQALITLERLPFTFKSNQLSFVRGTGRFTFTATEAVYLREKQAGQLDRAAEFGGAGAANPAALRHYSNEELYRHCEMGNLTSWMQTVETSTDGSAYLRSIALRPKTTGSFRAHFPYEASFSWDTTGFGVPGQIILTNDRVDSSSLIEGAQGTHLRYARDCPEAATCTPPAATAGFALVLNTPSGSEWKVTESGGLTNTTTYSSRQIQWGTVTTSPSNVFAQNLGPFSGGSVLMPGNFLPRRLVNGSVDPGVTALAVEDRPAALHLAGLNGTTPEWPGTPAYSTGAGDYAGLNVRMANGTASATSTIAGQALGPYSLTANSKFYLRAAGVNGKLESAPMTITRRIYGMDMQMRNMRLAFLNGENNDSAVTGSLLCGTNPAANRASNFALDFERLIFTCRGGLESATLGPSPDFTLSYWGTVIRPMALDFAQPGPCADAALGFLKLGCRAKLPSLGGADPWLSGVLGFRGADGSLVAKGDPDAAGSGLTSRMKVPGQIPLRGPGSTNYVLTPITEAYLNRWPGSGGAPAVGFANLLGTVDVPFFQSPATHLQTTANSNPAIVDTLLIGPDLASGALTSSDFDPQHLGTPPGISLATYRSGYPLHAKKSWLGMVNFDFPVRWQGTERKFESSSPISSNLLVVTPQARVEALTPVTADVSFGVDFSTAPSQLNLASLTSELAGAGGSLLSTLSNNLGISFPEVIGNLGNFEKAFADNLRDLMRPGVKGLTDPVAAQLYSAAVSEAAAKSALSFQLANLGASSQPLRTSVSGLIGTPGASATGAAKIIADLRFALNNTNKILNTIKALGAAANYTLPPAVTEAIAQLDLTLSQLQTDFSGLVTSAATGALGSALQANLPNSTAWEGLLTNALTRLHEVHGPSFATAFSGAGGQTAFQTAFADALMDDFLGHPSAADLQQVLRTHLSPLRDALRDTTDTLLSTINRAAGSATGAIGAEIFSACSGVFGGSADTATVQTAQLTGYARINGDSLKELRLDAKVNLKTPDDSKFEASLLVRDLQSDTPGSPSHPASSAAADVTITAATTANFSGSETDIEVAAKIALDASGSPIGLSGRLGINGEMDFQGLTITTAELGFGFGAADAYLYGKAGAKSELFDLEAAIFLGRTVDPDVLLRVDPSVAKSLAAAGAKIPGSDFGLPAGGNPLYGVYAYGYGAISVNSLIGIPPSPMLNIKAGSGAGYGIFYRGNSLALAMRQTLGVSGQVLVIAEIGATLDLTAAAVAAKLPGQSVWDALANAAVAGQASANFEIEIGVDPFSVEFEKTFTLYFSLGGSDGSGLQVDYAL